MVATNEATNDLADVSQEEAGDVSPAARRQPRRLSPQERATLRHCEVAIRRGFRAFAEAGKALATIRNQRLYRENYRSFKAYCITEYKFGYKRALQLIEAVDVMRDLEGTGVAPLNEYQVRPLVGLDSDMRKEAWAKAVEITGGTTPTQQQVEVAVEAISVPPEPRTEEEEQAVQLTIADMAGMIDHMQVLMKRVNDTVGQWDYRGRLLTLEERRELSRPISTLLAALRDLKSVLGF